MLRQLMAESNISLCFYSRLARPAACPRLTSSDVEPVGVVRGLLLVCCGLDDVDPHRDLKLACIDSDRCQLPFAHLRVQSSQLGQLDTHRSA